MAESREAGRMSQRPVRIPVFPLPNTVLFPDVRLPLHIFEPRYRELVSDLSRGEWDRLVGVMLLRGAEGEPDAESDVYEIGCAGRVVHVEPLEDGRSNVVLQGVGEFSVVRVHRDRPYRTAEVSWWPGEELGESLEPDTRTAILQQLRSPGRSGLTDAPDREVVHSIAFGTPLPPIEKQAILEVRGLRARAQRLLDALQLARLERRLRTSGPLQPQ